MTSKKVPKTRFFGHIYENAEISIFTAQVKMTLKISKMAKNDIKNNLKLQVFTGFIKVQQDRNRLLKVLIGFG